MSCSSTQWTATITTQVTELNWLLSNLHLCVCGGGVHTELCVILSHTSICVSWISSLQSWSTNYSTFLYLLLQSQPFPDRLTHCLPASFLSKLVKISIGQPFSGNNSYNSFYNALLKCVWHTASCINTVHKLAASDICISPRTTTKTEYF